ncbi:hypothetical protein EVAR_22282_1 [Eumeta japonica]|uniref:Uncharacterized protein n=1 Tax=Eumeta variegata TaxID=151549 RepID=A0A4C1UAG3_EUMVA|nr:hypothetical protein EVAR_22282_1 [Eumeta japonica]
MLIRDTFEHERDGTMFIAKCVAGLLNRISDGRGWRGVYGRGSAPLELSLTRQNVITEAASSRSYRVRRGVTQPQ